VKRADVRNNCKTYIVYCQLRTAFDGLRPQHFSLIQGAVTNQTLTSRTGYFTIDMKTFEMDEPSLAKLNDLCQFDRRDDQGFVKIIPEPREFKLLARLVNESLTNEHEAVRDHAKGLINEVEAGNRPLESAVDSLVSFINQKEWARALMKALDRQETSLQVEAYRPIGNALLHKNEVCTTFARLRRVLDV